MIVIKIRLYAGVENHLSENGFSFEEEIKLYDDQLADLLLHTRWYLDNLDYLATYRVSWKNYRNNRPVTPYRYTRKGKNKNVYKGGAPIL